jgi:hypothetical protein
MSLRYRKTVAAVRRLLDCPVRRAPPEGVAQIAASRATPVGAGASERSRRSAAPQARLGLLGFDARMSRRRRPSSQRCSRTREAKLRQAGRHQRSVHRLRPGDRGITRWLVGELAAHRDASAAANGDRVARTAANQELPDDAAGGSRASLQPARAPLVRDDAGGCSSSCSATAPPAGPTLLAPPFVLVSLWLALGATVTALRGGLLPGLSALHPIAVHATRAAALFAGMLVVSYWLGRSPGGP